MAGLGNDTLSGPVDLSIVTTLYRSASYLPEFVQRASAAARKLTERYEILLVDDGSPDTSLDIALNLQKADAHLVVISLSRNFGHHVAMMTGLTYAHGERVFLIDSDLEEAPEWLTAFDQMLQAQHADVVYGVQDKRKGGLWERFSGWAFYKILNFLSSTPIPASAATARLMSRRYVEALASYPERELFLHGLMPHVGFKQIPHTIQKHSKGSSSYGLARKLRLAVNAITAFSNKPLIYIFYTGFLISGGAAGYILWLLHRRYFYGIPILGWPSLIVSVWFLGGLTILFIGVLGIYLAKVFSEIKQRPRAIVRQVTPASYDRARATLP